MNQSAFGRGDLVLVGAHCFEPRCRNVGLGGSYHRREPGGSYQHDPGCLNGDVDGNYHFERGPWSLHSHLGNRDQLDDSCRGALSS